MVRIWGALLPQEHLNKMISSYLSVSLSLSLPSQVITPSHSQPVAVAVVSSTNSSVIRIASQETRMSSSCEPLISFWSYKNLERVCILDTQWQQLQRGLIGSLFMFSMEKMEYHKNRVAWRSNEIDYKKDNNYLRCVKQLKPLAGLFKPVSEL